MSERREFVALASEEDANMSALCRLFGISRKTGYKLLRRFREDGVEGLKDHSRRPRASPRRTPAEL
ncbi:MAG TPA: helix-turn-helix domain-containing protein, partial [Dehalococcoidia bacterium]